MPPLPSDLDARLQPGLDSEAKGEPKSRAAVALVLDLEPGAQSILLMTRAVSERDPWSGHVSLPGGRHEPFDPHLAATAIRETREEVGLDLERGAELLGRLDPVRAQARGRPISMDVTPFAFRLEAGQEAELSPGPEASDAFWLPLDRVVAGELDARHRYERSDGMIVHLPCWRFEERTVWGLTYKLLRTFLEVSGALPPASPAE